MKKNKSMCQALKTEKKNSEVHNSDSSQKSQLTCPFSCAGEWQNPESLKRHTNEFFLHHLENLNLRVIRLEETMKQNIAENVTDRMQMTLSQQQSLNLPLRYDSERQDAVGISLQVTQQPIQQGEVKHSSVSETSSVSQASPYKSEKADSSQFDVHHLSNQTRTYDSQQLVARSDSVATTTMKKLEICFQKTEKYEGIAMVLNRSLEKLLTQVKEIDNQRRRESESREAQERKIQVGVFLFYCCFY